MKYYHCPENRFPPDNSLNPVKAVLVKSRTVAKSLNQKSVIRLVAFLSLLLVSAYPAEAESAIVTEELLENASKYDATTITYKGEVIGDIMFRRESAWVNLRDETGAIGVFCPKELLKEIEHKGSYKFKGDIISVQGVFYRSCPEHGGDTDIHAQKITIIQKGKAIEHPLEPGKVKAGIILSAIAFVLLILHLLLRKFR